jgi:hypothetical protein
MRPLAGPARCTGSRRGDLPPWDQVAKAMSRRRVRKWLCARASQISAAGALAMPQKLNWSRLLRPECALALQTLAPRRPQIQLDASVARRLSKRLQERLHRTCRVTGDRVPAASPSRASAVQPDCAEQISRAAPPPTRCPEHAQHPPAARLHQTDLLGPVHLRLHQPQCAWMAQRARGAPGSCVLSATSERISPHLRHHLGLFLAYRAAPIT